MNTKHKFPHASTYAITLFALSMSLLLAGCSGPQPGRSAGEGHVTYGDPHAVETVTADFGSTDLQNTAESMTQSLISSRWIIDAATPPLVRLREVGNYTTEHIDTKGITDKIRINLLKSGRVRFLADEYNLGDVYAERELTTRETGKSENNPMLASTYIITGSVRSVKKATKEAGDIYYQITMELIDPQRGEVLWADEQEIRKTTSKPKIGW